MPGWGRQIVSPTWSGTCRPSTLSLRLLCRLRGGATHPGDRHAGADADADPTPGGPAVPAAGTCPSWRCSPAWGSSSATAGRAFHVKRRRGAAGDSEGAPIRRRPRVATQPRRVLLGPGGQLLGPLRAEQQSVADYQSELQPGGCRSRCRPGRAPARDPRGRGTPDRPVRRPPSCGSPPAPAWKRRGTGRSPGSTVLAHLGDHPARGERDEQCRDEQDHERPDDRDLGVRHRRSPHGTPSATCWTMP